MVQASAAFILSQNSLNTPKQSDTTIIFIINIYEFCMNE